MPPCGTHNKKHFGGTGISMAAKNTAVQQALDLRPNCPVEEWLLPFRGPCALEDDNFPFEVISDVAEIESWRKEINRPVYHIHKWWARRLGTVFRAIVLGALTPLGTDLLKVFYRAVRLKDITIFDPFMGSGTTIGEAVKLGARSIGRDINPVAYFLVKNALGVYDRDEVLAVFREIESDVANQIKSFYKTKLEDGAKADVLYFFWVMQVECPECASNIDLFSSRIFARHTDAKRHPEAQAICPVCDEITPVRHDAMHATCKSCLGQFDPQAGAANGQMATCTGCAHTFSIAKTIRKRTTPPAHRLYAKLVLTGDGKKRYLSADAGDHELFAKAARRLAGRRSAYPVVAIEPGYNTNQALGYNYRYWHEMFNARQLLCLSILTERIREIADPALRELFTCLFSGMLEFNNLFTSYKGEGTGAVRHMFAHHILKPERTPIEANPWGTPKSSGSFMTMFERRIQRALNYAGDPFELKIHDKNTRRVEKIYGLSEQISSEIAEDYASFGAEKQVYLSCGDSSKTDIPPGCVDAIISDPPFFDNVHYSQLADFFHVWQRHILGEEGPRESRTTRSDAEVQSADVTAFTERLSGVWAEAHRVLADDGILVFTYHHSRNEGWRSILHALMRAKFGITAAYPIKAEMSVAMPKHQAREPINLDIILVCRKRSRLSPRRWNGDLRGTVCPKAAMQVQRFRARGRKLSRNDVRVIVMAQLVRQLSLSHKIDEAVELLDSAKDEIEAAIQSIHQQAQAQ